MLISSYIVANDTSDLVSPAHGRLLWNLQSGIEDAASMAQPASQGMERCT